MKFALIAMLMMLPFTLKAGSDEDKEEAEEGAKQVEKSLEASGELITMPFLGAGRRLADVARLDTVCRKVADFLGESKSMRRYVMQGMKSSGSDNQKVIDEATEVVLDWCKSQVDDDDVESLQCVFYLSFVRALKPTLLQQNLLGMFGTNEQKKESCGNVVRAVNKKIENGGVKGVSVQHIKSPIFADVVAVEDCGDIEDRAICEAMEPMKACSWKKSTLGFEDRPSLVTRLSGILDIPEDIKTGTCVKYELKEHEAPLHYKIASVRRRLHETGLEAMKLATGTVALILAGVCRRFDNPALLM